MLRACAVLVRLVAFVPCATAAVAIAAASHLCHFLPLPKGPLFRALPLAWRERAGPQDEAAASNPPDDQTVGLQIGVGGLHRNTAHP